MDSGDNLSINLVKTFKSTHSFIIIDSSRVVAEEDLLWRAYPTLRAYRTTIIPVFTRPSGPLTSPSVALSDESAQRQRDDPTAH